MQYEHKIAEWEKKWGRLKIKNSSMLTALSGRRFTMFINTRAYHDRSIDKQGRIWVGLKALQDFYAGEKVIIELREEQVYVTKKT